MNKYERNINRVPAEVHEDSAATISREQGNRHWLDAAFSDFEKKGGLEHLAGKGKPLNVQSGEPLNHVMKEASILPAWLQLQHEIRDELQALIAWTGSDAKAEVASRVEEINKKIAKYNSSVPDPILQKMKITKDDFAEKAAKWL